MMQVCPIDKIWTRYEQLHMLFGCFFVANLVVQHAEKQVYRAGLTHVVYHMCVLPGGMKTIQFVGKNKNGILKKYHFRRNH